MGLFNRKQVDNAHDDLSQVDPKTRRALKRAQKERDKKLFVRDNALRDVVAKGGYRFHSNYFDYGDRVGTVLTLVEADQGDRDLIPFWKVWLIPKSSTLNDSLDEKSPDAVFGAHGQLFDMMENKTKSWAEDKQGKAESSTEMETDTADGGSQQRKVGTRRNDNEIISFDRSQGDMYASTEYKVLLTAKNLHDLDLVVTRYKQNLANHFDSMHFETYQGQQETDLHNLLQTADMQLGHHPMATSSEYAGGYEILTRGVTDPNGDYIGQMVGDVNNTAVLMDLDNYDQRVVLAHSANAYMLHGIGPAYFDVGTRSTTLMGVRLAQSALVNNHRVIHLVLNGSKPQNIGANLNDITTVISLNGGGQQAAINPFEIFGEDPSLSDQARRRQFSYFPPHVQKLRLMVKQITPEIESTDLNEQLTNVLRDYYKHTEMLVDNPTENYKKLRLVGMPHKNYPKLDRFLLYLDQRRKEYSDENDQESVKRIDRLHSAFNAMYRDNPDLFNVVTNDNVDSAKSSPQVVYDFSSLRAKRGVGVAMAQFINAIRYATDQLEEGDVVILHGVDELADSVKSYVNDVFTDLNHNGIRLVFLYDDPEKCLKDIDFNKLGFADWTMMGGFNASVIDTYQNLMKQPLPEGLKAAILDFGESSYGRSIYYLSRGIDNVLFALDMNLGSRNGGYLAERPKGMTRTSIDKS